MEMYRQCGVEAAIRKAGLPPERAGFIVWARTLAGEEIERRVPWRSRPAEHRRHPGAQLPVRPGRPRAGAARLRRAPGAAASCASAPRSRPCDQDDDGVTATLRRSRERRRGSRSSAQYVIAADGAQSPIRQQLGVRMDGRGGRLRQRQHPAQRRSPAVDGATGRPRSISSSSRRLRGTFLTINGIDRWGFLVNSLAAYGYTAERLHAGALGRARAPAAGVPDLDVKILGVAPWTASAHVAERYRPRPHLPGRRRRPRDAADRRLRHEHRRAGRPQPRLEAGLRAAGAAEARACSTAYHDERQPLGRAITEQSLANAISMGRLQTAPPGPRAPGRNTSTSRA